MALRVLRLIEYVYRDEEVATEDMLRWTVTAAPRRGIVMRSAVLPFEAWPDWPQSAPVIDRDRLRALVLDYTNRVEGPTLRLEGGPRPEVDGFTDQLLELLSET